MKINDLHSTSECDFIPFYKVPVGSVFQVYTWIPIEVRGYKAYLSNFLTKTDKVWSVRTSEKGDRVLLDPNELVKKISSNEDTNSSSS